MPEDQSPPQAVGGERLWIATLTARAAFRFEERQQITIAAGPATEVPVTGIRLRNHICWATDDHSEGAPSFVGGFVGEAAGRFEGVEDAVALLANLANSYFQVLALAANAGVEEPEDLVAYSPPINDTDEGQFVIQRHSQARAPAARLRKLAAADVLELLKPLNAHANETRLHRAMAHYRMALNELDPMNRVLSAESLWMAVENLSHVILDRLRSEHGLPQTPEGKHQLACKLGFEPRSVDELSWRTRLGMRLGGLSRSQLRADRSHLSRLDRHIRLDVIFQGDEQCYKQLKDGSDGFEHGYMDFGQVQAKSKVADQAFTYVRQALLNEIGVPDDSPLRASRFDSPLGVWRPAFEGHGVYTDSAPQPLPTLTPENINEAWPDPVGLSLVPMMKAVVDNDDGTRSLTFEVNGAASGLSETQKASIRESKWLGPGGTDSKIISEHVTAKLNGEVVHDEYVVPQEPDSEEDA